jgi:energy-coupling factor transport system substrate-specific component
MATHASSAATPQSRWVRPLVPILIVLAVGIVFLFIGSAIASAQSPDAAPLDVVKMIPYLVIGAAIAYGIGVLAGDQDLWKFGTREVVYAAIGAALYGVLSWATNVIPMPAVSQVTLRPAIVIPIFFGIVFGPAVGFFSGFVGNVLGDAITGWGVFPIWDIGNGLIGLVAGLSMAFRSSKQSLNILLGIVVAFNLVVAALLVAFPDTENVLFGEGTVGGFWWVPVLIAVLVAAAWFVLRGREDLAAAEVWGVLGIIVGIGFAAMADIWWNGYSFITALLGEFVPAAGSNLVNSLILLPLLLIAWKSAQARTGR